MYLSCSQLENHILFNLKYNTLQKIMISQKVQFDYNVQID
jgi:hypothetical protein